MLTNWLLTSTSPGVKVHDQPYTERHLHRIPDVHLYQLRLVLYTYIRNQ